MLSKYSCAGVGPSGRFAAMAALALLMACTSVTAAQLSALHDRDTAYMPYAVGSAESHAASQYQALGPGGDGIGSNPLIKIHVDSQEGWRILHSLGAELYLRGDGYAVVRLKREALVSLETHALSWRELSPECPQSLFYLMPERGSPPLDSYDVRTLDADREGFLVSASPEVAASAVAGGYKAMPLDRTWPISPVGFLDVDFIHEVVEPDDEFQQLLQSVNQDTLSAYIQHLEDYGTRYTSSPQTIKAARWLVRQLFRFGYADTFLQTVVVDQKVSIAPPNVAATKPGTGRPRFRIIVGGHYDSTVNEGTVSPMEKAPGANDNASGTAATLEIARLLAEVPLDATVQFALFTAEEQGLHGSKEFAIDLTTNGVLPEEVFVINMDMIGNAYGRQWKVKLYYDIPSLPMAEFAARISETYTPLQPLMAGYSSRSDHVSFQQFGYRAITFHEAGEDPNYHTVNDRLISLEIDYMAEVVKAVMGTVLHLARVAEPPDPVAVTETESGELSVEWNHSTDADVLRYHVEFLNDDGALVARHSTQYNWAVFDPDSLGDVSWVRVRAEDVLGESAPSELLLVGSGGLVVRNAKPNPARSLCSFDVFIPGAGDPVRTSLRIVDASGRLVRSIENERLPRGSHVLQWDTTAQDGSAVPSGIYFYVVEADGVGRSSGKIMVAR